MKQENLINKEFAVLERTLKEFEEAMVNNPSKKQAYNTCIEYLQRRMTDLQAQIDLMKKCVNYVKALTE